MKKVLVIIATLGSLSTFTFAYEPPNKLWCQQNWDKCKQFMEESLKIRERSIARERDCLQKAGDFPAFRGCKAQAKEQTKKEMFELRQRFMQGAGR